MLSDIPRFYRNLQKRIRPHQLRHLFASRILNAGAPVETVQLLLGHKRVQTTLGYARVYDGTAAADYYQAMQLVESRLNPSTRHAFSLSEMLLLIEAFYAASPAPSQIAFVADLINSLKG